MNCFRKQLPDGLQDYLPDECFNKRAVEERIRKTFYLGGYSEIETPSMEYYDVFASGIGSVRQEKMIKFIDTTGRILVLRPDMTIPIARVMGTKPLDMPARLFYIGNAFGHDGSFYSTQREFTQAGVELLGLPGPEADAEVIALAVEALTCAGLKCFQIDIGQVEFFKGLMEEAGLTSEESEELRILVDQKNDLAVELFLHNRGIGGDVKKRIMKLSTLYGGAEVFDEALRFSSSKRCRAAVENLREVYDILCQFGVQQYISIDFGMLQSIDYYSGIIFKGMSGDLGQSLLSGGRYDKLLGEFGLEAPATGFALGIKRSMIALERQGGLRRIPGIDCVVSCDKSARALAYERMNLMRDRGQRVEAALHLSQSELEAYASKLGARAMYFKEGEKE